jgi:hypothetical protein
LFLFWIWNGVTGPWSKLRILFIFILFNKMNEDMYIKEIAKILLITYLLNHPFNSLSYNKLLVKSQKQPQPNLTGLILCVSGKQKRSFNTTWYQKCTWLVGSVNKNLLFCWPCLLFAAETENTVWSRLGFNDFKNIARCICSGKTEQ